MLRSSRSAIARRLRNRARQLANSPTRRHCLDLARRAFGPYAKLTRTPFVPAVAAVAATDTTPAVAAVPEKPSQFVVSVKPPGREHMFLGIGNSWLEAIKDAQDTLLTSTGQQEPAEPTKEQLMGAAMKALTEPLDPEAPGQGADAAGSDPKATVEPAPVSEG